MKKNYQNIVILFLVAFLIMLPMFIFPYHRGHDTEYHVVNIVGLKEQMEKSFFSPHLIVGITANNFGYGTRIFYPPLSSSVVSTVLLVSHNVTFSLKLTHFLILFLSGISMYYLSLRLSENKKIALLSGVIYMLFPYHLSEIYIRDALAESFLFPFIPLIIYSVLEWREGNLRKFYPLFIIGYAGGFLSHFTMMLYFTYFLFAYFLIHYKITFQWKKLKPLLIGTLLVTLLCSPFFETMIEHKFFGDYAIFIPNYMAGNIQWAAKGLLDYVNIFKEFHEFEVKYYLDIFTLILLFVTLFHFKKFKNYRKYIPILIFGALSVYFSTKYFYWDILPGFLRMIQFPWRMETFAAVAISLIAPLSFLLIQEEKQNKYLFCFIIGMLIFGFITLPTKNLVRLNINPMYEAAGMGWNQEYLPTNTLYHQDYFNNRGNGIITSDAFARITVIDNDVPTLTFMVENIKEMVSLELPRLYYLGYELKDETGKKVMLHEDEFGFMEAQISENGKYTLEYVGTHLYRICRILSFATILFCLGYCILKRGVCCGKN